MAVVGYHFGSKDALLNEAFRQANIEWATEIQKALTVPGDFVEIWTRVIDSFTPTAPSGQPPSRSSANSTTYRRSTNSSPPASRRSARASRTDARVRNSLAPVGRLYQRGL
jgi:hypothetical protein